MAFTVEAGDGEDPEANSYASVAEFKAYWDERGYDYTVKITKDLERALVKATDFIERKYGRYFIGCRLLGATQPLSWPRAYAMQHGSYIEGLPADLVQATHEYAKIVLDNPEGLAPNPAGYDTTGAEISKQSTKVGPIEKSVEYTTGTQTQLRSYPFADGLLADLVVGSSGTMRN